MAEFDKPVLLEDRGMITLSGPEKKSFLQGLITNDVDKISGNSALYAALLTPQGKYLHDFFIFDGGGKLWIDCEKDRRDDLVRRLMMYRLRADVEISPADHIVMAAPGPVPGAIISAPDPRCEALGYRNILTDIPDHGTAEAYDRLRLACGVPDGARDFTIDGTLILEGNMAELHGVDFDKGCYVGQEVTARMKYRASLKKRLLPVTVDGPLPERGTVITNEAGKKIGDIRSGRGNRAIGYFRLADMRYGVSYDCGAARVSPWRPDWLAEEKTE